MNPVQLTLRENEDIKTYIDNFDLNKVVLKNYFYATDSNLFKDSNIYTPEQIGVILNLTDREYADLVSKYLNNNTENAALQPPPIDNSAKLAELEAKLEKSRKFEESKNKLKDYEDELVSVRHLLSSVQMIQEKYEDAMKEYSDYSHLNKYNLAKVHEDLIVMINETNHFEQEILNYKGNVIQKASSHLQYDKGKIGLGIGIFLAFLFVSIGLIILEAETFLIAAVLGVGLILLFLSIFLARMEIDYPIDNSSEGQYIDKIKSDLEILKSKRKKLIELVGFTDSDEFFNAKARFGAISKSLQYLTEQRLSMLNGEDYDSLKKREDELLGKVNEINELTKNESDLLKPEEYLNVRREADYLKLSVGQIRQNQSLSKADIIKKLDVIKNELLVKLPEFCQILKENFKRSFITIKGTFDDLCVKLGLKSIQIDDQGNGFDEMKKIEKTLLQYSLFKEIYKRDFAFAIGYLSSWERSEREALLEFIQSTEENESAFYILDKSI
jgi:hypothetical protein